MNRFNKKIYILMRGLTSLPHMSYEMDSGFNELRLRYLHTVIDRAKYGAIA